MIANEVQTVMLMFHLTVPRAAQAGILRFISEWTHVVAARPLVPEATSADAARMACVYADEGADIKALRERLERLEEVESASIPAARANI